MKYSVIARVVKKIALSVSGSQLQDPPNPLIINKMNYLDNSCLPWWVDITLPQKIKKYVVVGRMGGSVFGRLPSVEVMIPGSWDRAPASGSLLSRKPVSPSPTPPACVPSLTVSLCQINKLLKKKSCCH